MLRLLMTTMTGTVAGRRETRRASRRARIVDVVPSCAADLITAEIGRARRHERPFSVLHIPLTPAGQPSRDHVARLISSVLRDCDRMVVAAAHISILLPETDSAGARICVDRLAAVTGLDAQGVHRASFPSDGVTTGALCAVLSGKARLVTDAIDLPVLRDPRRVRELAG
jgi:hypothetical protein